MPFVQAGQLARPTPTALVNDSLGLVAENLRASNYGTIPVVDRPVIEDLTLPPPAEQARVLGLIDERDLARAVLPALERQQSRNLVTASTYSASSLLTVSGYDTGLNGHGTLPPAPDPAEENDRVERLTAQDVMQTDIGFIPAVFSLHNALLTLDRYDMAALPVVDAAGGYRGMISRADIVAAIGRQVRPPMVGGMATPLGVWLTNGTVSAGAPPLGIFLAGVVLGLCHAFSHFGMLLGLAAYDHFAVNSGTQLAPLFVSGRVSAYSDNDTAISAVMAIVQFLLFAGALRLLPMSGIHAAEHQTVWAMEKGLPLTPEIVGRMPRAHPRCGTNLVALLVLVIIIFQHLPRFDSLYTIGALVVVFFGWRSFGTALQIYLTTRPASKRELESGIRAGRELLEKYQDQDYASVMFQRRSFNYSLLLCAAGLWAVLALHIWAMELLAARLGMP